MGWEFVVVLAIVSLIIVPAAFFWYQNVSAMYTAVRQVLERRSTRRRGTG